MPGRQVLVTPEVKMVTCQLVNDLLNGEADFLLCIQGYTGIIITMAHFSLLAIQKKCKQVHLDLPGYLNLTFYVDPFSGRHY